MVETVSGKRSPAWASKFIGFAALIGISLGALWAGKPRLEVAGLIALFALVAIRAIPVFGQITTSFSSLLSALPAVSEIRKLLEELANCTEHQGPLPRSPIGAGSISSKVVFAYHGRTANVLGPLSLTIKRHRSYGIVGPSGAGKSTLVDIIAGLLQPTNGRMMVDARVIDDQNAASWRSRIAYVPQDPFLIDATLADNIAFGHEVTGNARCREALDRHLLVEPRASGRRAAGRSE